MQGHVDTFVELELAIVAIIVRSRIISNGVPQLVSLSIKLSYA